MKNRDSMTYWSSTWPSVFDTKTLPRIDDRILHDANRRARLMRVRRLARFMDTAVRIPGTKIRFGLDSLVGVIPGVGDIASMLVSAYVVRQAYSAGVSKWILAKMVGNIGVDALVGVIPIAGDLFDVFFKANIRNARMLEQALERESPR